MTAKRPYYPALDGLRFFCATSVIIAHAFDDQAIHSSPNWASLVLDSNLGAMAVNVFFALSGFLITGLLLDEKRRSASVDLRAFYIRRTLRIWPAFYAALFLGYVTVLLGGPRIRHALLFAPTKDVWRYSLPFFFAMNLVSAPTPTLINPLWSVCVEEQFYVVFPVLFVFSRRAWPVFRVVGIAILVAWITRVWLAPGGEAAFYRNSIAHGDHLLLGALCAQITRAWPEKTARWLRHAGGIGEIACVAGVLTIIVATRLGPPVSRFGWWLNYASSAVACAALVLSMSAGAGPVSRFLSVRPLRRLGDVTYGCYVFHEYSVFFAWIVTAHLTSSPWLRASVRAVLAVFLAYGVAFVSRRWLEEPFLRLKDRFMDRRMIGIAAA